jgi:AraC-like DNA-binding protein
MRGGSLVSNKSTPLPKWRLKRAIDYIEANLTRPIYLAEISNAAGLTRMHFAAEFRAATGCSPSNYILRRKVAHAQQLLLDPRLSIADVATTMGFSTQAHFTVVSARLLFAGASALVNGCSNFLTPFDLNNPRSILKDALRPLFLD